MNQSVVITGLGAISGAGYTVEDFWNSVCAGDSAISELRGDDAVEIAGVKITRASQVPDYDPGAHFSDDELSLLDRYSQYAVLAARQAIEDAGLQADSDELHRAAAIIGSGCGGKHTDEETYAQLYKQQRKRAHPLTIPKGMPSAAASMVSFHLGIRGPVFTISSACSSSAHAIAQAAMMIQTGMVDIAIAGGTDAPFTYGLLKAWEAVRVVSNDTCRPFSKDRSGMVLGEGAGVIVLESESHARQRGADMYARLLGYGMSADAGHVTRPDVSGISRVISAALQNAGVNPEQVDYVNAHGTATQANDVAETRALYEVFGKDVKRMPVSSTKAVHGHALGATSALELIATTLAMRQGAVPPTANFNEVDEQCDIDCVPGEAREQNIDIALSSSFAFGGLNAVLALQSCPRLTTL